MSSGVSLTLLKLLTKFTIPALNSVLLQLNHHEHIIARKSMIHDHKRWAKY